MYYVYILKLNNGQLYAGRTKNLKARFKQHQDGRVDSTTHKRPLCLLFYEAFLSKQDTIRRECYFKTTKGKATLQLMLRESLQGSSS